MTTYRVGLGWRSRAIGLMEEIRPLSGRIIFLLIALYINRKVAHFLPSIWLLIPIALSLSLVRARYDKNEAVLIRLWQLVGLLSAVYSVTHYPLMAPAQDSAGAAGLYGLLLLAWAVSTACGVLCFRFPSLAILPSAFLLWSNLVAGRVTGLPVTIYIDVQPLTEVSVCIGLGLCISRLFRLQDRRRSTGRPEEATGALPDRKTGAAFAELLLLIAIAVHLANYFWSFHKKMTLDGPWASWLTENNPAFIFLAALDDGHILFSAYPRLVGWTYAMIDATHFYANLWVLLIQAATIAAFFMPKRPFIVLLLMLDIMHLAIILIVGANFWPWIVLNIVIVVVVARADFPRPSLLSRLVATGFILVAPHFVQVTKLGWYDSGANNKIYVEAVDTAGTRYPVPTNFFTFYSYSLGHMDYGAPDPASAFVTGAPNGGTWDYRVFRAGRQCDVATLRRPLRIHQNQWIFQDAVAAFVRNYHALALAIHSKLGAFPYNAYSHHFYVPPSVSGDFDRLDKGRIVAYIYRRESVCLSFGADALNRKVVATAEYRIDVSGAEQRGGRRN